MKKALILALIGVAAFGVDTVNLTEAERLEAAGKAIIVDTKGKDIVAVMEADEAAEKIKKSIDSNKTSTAEAPVVPLAQIEKQPEPKAPPVVIEGISIEMPMTLKQFLRKTTALNGQVYYCSEDINIPSAHMKIYGIEHLDKYMRQVANIGIEVVRDSSDPMIPRVVKPVKLDKGSK